jgi:hypothetical protein
MQPTAPTCRFLGLHSSLAEATAPELCRSGKCCGLIDRRAQSRARCFGVVGPERAAVFGLRAEVERTAARKSALRGRPISEKALVILECKEACENTELAPLNVVALNLFGVAT